MKKLTIYKDEKNVIWCKTELFDGGFPYCDIERCYEHFRENFMHLSANTIHEYYFYEHRQCLFSVELHRLTETVKTNLL
jgi:hypothetical protein